MKELPSEGVASCRREQELGECLAWTVRTECRTSPERKKFVAAGTDVPAVLPFSLTSTSNIFNYLYICITLLCRLSWLLSAGDRDTACSAIEKIPPLNIFLKKPASPYRQRGRFTCSALWERDTTRLSRSRGGCGCWRATTSSLLQYSALPVGLALMAAGFILLVWHRETNETSQPSWEAAVTQAWMKLWHGEVG